MQEATNATILYQQDLFKTKLRYNYKLRNVWTKRQVTVYSNGELTYKSLGIFSRQKGRFSLLDYENIQFVTLKTCKTPALVLIPPPEKKKDHALYFFTHTNNKLLESLLDVVKSFFVKLSKENTAASPDEDDEPFVSIDVETIDSLKINDKYNTVVCSPVSPRAERPKSRAFSESGMAGIILQDELIRATDFEIESEHDQEHITDATEEVCCSEDHSDSEDKKEETEEAEKTTEAETEDEEAVIEEVAVEKAEEAPIGAIASIAAAEVIASVAAVGAIASVAAAETAASLATVGAVASVAAAEVVASVAAAEVVASVVAVGAVASVAAVEVVEETTVESAVSAAPIEAVEVVDETKIEVVASVAAAVEAAASVAALTISTEAAIESSEQIQVDQVAQETHETNQESEATPEVEKTISNLTSSRVRQKKRRPPNHAPPATPTLEVDMTNEVPEIVAPASPILEAEKESETQVQIPSEEPEQQEQKPRRNIPPGAALFSIAELANKIKSRGE